MLKPVDMEAWAQTADQEGWTSQQALAHLLLSASEETESGESYEDNPSGEWRYSE